MLRTKTQTVPQVKQFHVIVQLPEDEKGWRFNNDGYTADTITSGLKQCFQWLKDKRNIQVQRYGFAWAEQHKNGRCSFVFITRIDGQFPLRPDRLGISL